MPVFSFATMHTAVDFLLLRCSIDWSHPYTPTDNCDVRYRENAIAQYRVTDFDETNVRINCFSQNNQVFDKVIFGPFENCWLHSDAMKRWLPQYTGNGAQQDSLYHVENRIQLSSITFSSHVLILIWTGLQVQYDWPQRLQRTPVLRFLFSVYLSTLHKQTRGMSMAGPSQISALLMRCNTWSLKQS
jgi:hypothetical protein